MGQEIEFRGVVAEWFWKNYVRTTPDRDSWEKLDSYIKERIDERVQVYLNLKILFLLRMRGIVHMAIDEKANLNRAFRRAVDGRIDAIARSAVQSVRAAFDDLLERVDLKNADTAEGIIEDSIDNVSGGTLDRLDLNIERAVERIVAP